MADQAGFSSLPRGANFYKADLHLHTFGPSPDVIDEGMTPAAIVEIAHARGLGLIAITDHNSIASVPDLLKAARQTDGLTAIPGVEITTTHGHVLVYCSPESLPHLERMLQRIDFLEDEDGGLYTRSRIDELAEVASAFGGIVVPAHVGRINTGFMNRAPHRERQAVFVTRGITTLELDPDQLQWFGVGDTDEGHELRGEYLTKRAAALGVPADELHLGRVLFSDAHDLQSIGRSRAGGERLTRIKMDEPSFDSLRLALLDPQARVLLEEPLPERYPRVVGVRYLGGFLSDQEIAFAPNLTAIIGGRGAGKSTALEALRAACLGIDSPLSESAAWPESVQLEYLDEFGQPHLIQRDSGTEEAYELVDGEAVPARFELEGYEQDHIAELVRNYETQPGLLLDFLDDFVGLESIRLELAQAADDLAANADGLLALWDAPQQLKGAKDGLAVIARKIETAEKTKAKAALAFRRTLAAESSLRQAVREEVTAVRDFISELPTGVDLEDLALAAGIPDVATAAARKLLAGVDAAAGSDNLLSALTDLQADLETWKAEGEERFAKHSARLDAIFALWESRGRQLEQRVKSIVEQLIRGGITPNLQALNQLAADESALKKQVTDQTKRVGRRSELLRDRSLLLARHRRLEGQIASRRQVFARSLTERFARSTIGYQAGFKLREGELVPEYESWLRRQIGNRFLRGERVTEFCQSIHPMDLAAAARLNKVARVESLSDRRGSRFFSRGEAAELLTTLRATPAELFTLETITRDERPEITLAVRNADKVTAVRFESLSLGQKASILLGVLLFSDRTQPLVIDQPEDHLDSAFIYSAVVQTLREVKERRQVIVATHNANIAVLGDAELIIPLRSWQGRGAVVDRGSVDNSASRDRACRILEGGRAAYRRRGEMYGFGFTDTGSTAGTSRTDSATAS